MQSQTTSSGTEAFLAWNSGIDLGLDFRTGIELTFLGLNKEFVPTVINGPVWPLWESPTNITLTSTLPAEITAGNVIPLKFKVTDLPGDPVTHCPVCITGDGTFSKQIIFTNISGEASTNWTIPNSSGNNTFSATIYRADKTLIESKNYSLQVSSTVPSVTTLSATNAGETSATLNGNVTSDGGSIITQRGFYWSSTDQTPDAGDNKTVVSGTTGSFSKEIYGLTSNSTYYFKAFATNSKGTGTGSTKQFTTDYNVALSSNGGKATAISEGYYDGTTHYAYLAIDNDKDSFWASKGDMPAWLKIEFNQVYSIKSVGVWWGSHKHNYTISLSLDGNNWTPVHSGTSNNSEGAFPVHEEFTIDKTSARFMKIDITSTSAPSSHIFQSIVNEIEANGKIE